MEGEELVDSEMVCVPEFEPVLEGDDELEMEVEGESVVEEDVEMVLVWEPEPERVGLCEQLEGPEPELDTVVVSGTGIL